MPKIIISFKKPRHIPDPVNNGMLEIYVPSSFIIIVKFYTKIYFTVGSNVVRTSELGLQMFNRFCDNFSTNTTKIKNLTHIYTHFKTAQGKFF